MRGMDFLSDRPGCEWPDFLRMNHHFRPPTREHHGGWARRKCNNDRRSSMDKTGQGTRRRQRDILLKRYGPICQLCINVGITDKRAVIDMDLTWPDPLCFTRDHIVPRSEGGSDEIDNLWPAHNICNANRGNKPHNGKRVAA